MNQSLFIQIHYLTAYHASLLNRDDVGMAKRIPFGGANRLRISSQCLKRHWRTAEGDHSLKSIGVDMSVRSREIFERMIARPLIEQGKDEEATRAILKSFQAELLGESVKGEKQTKSENSVHGKHKLQTSQIIVMGLPEINYIKDITSELISSAPTVEDAAKKARGYFKNKEHRKNLEALKNAAGLDAALFGRMVTSDVLARGDAAIHVAHAFTVHAEETETDYFTAVDDLLAEVGELGSAHINETELTSGIYYGYVVVDVPQLVSNLEGVDREECKTADRTLAAHVVENLIHIIATVSPGAKLGSTAPYSWAQMVLVEVGSRQPRTLANAYLEPVSTDISSAMTALGTHLKEYDRMYGLKEQRQVAALYDTAVIPAEKVDTIGDLAKWASDKIREEQ